MCRNGVWAVNIHHHGSIRTGDNLIVWTRVPWVLIHVWMSIFTLLSKIAKDDLSPRDGEGPVCPLGHLPADLPHVAGPGAREGCGRGGSPQVVGLARALHGHRANAGVPMIGLHGYTMVTISIGASKEHSSFPWLIRFYDIINIVFCSIPRNNSFLLSGRHPF